MICLRPLSLWQSSSRIEQSLARPEPECQRNLELLSSGGKLFFGFQDEREFS